MDNNMVDVDGKLYPLSKHAKKGMEVNSIVDVRLTDEGALIFYPLNCRINDRIETKDNLDNVYARGDEGTVVDIISYGIDILMDNGLELRVLNSDFHKHYKII